MHTAMCNPLALSASKPALHAQHSPSAPGVGLHAVRRSRPRRRDGFGGGGGDTRGIGGGGGGGGVRKRPLDLAEGGDPCIVAIVVRDAKNRLAVLHTRRRYRAAEPLALRRPVDAYARAHDRRICWRYVQALRSTWPRESNARTRALEPEPHAAHTGAAGLEARGACT